MNLTLQKLATAQKRNNSLLSIGLEPSPDYMFPGMTAGLSGFKTFLRVIINATRDICCAYKFNIAFFEALGVEGAELLYDIRSHLPEDVLIILDAKRGDIGSTARRYAFSYYDGLKVDAVTLNPLMGRDSAEPFLEYRDKLNIFLCLTSNPGAADFLMPNKMYMNIASAVSEWNQHGNCGLVVGATKPEQAGEIRSAAPKLPFLVPGIGAQGGDIASLAKQARMPGNFSGLMFHVTRGILPEEGDTRDPLEVVREKAEQWRDKVNEEMKSR